MKTLPLLLFTLLAVGIAGWPATSRAQIDPQITIDKVVDLNREGVELYKKKKFDPARKLLKQALDLCEAAGLEHHPVAARTHVHLGIVIVGGFGQREIGAKQFTAALQIQPDITLTPGLASPAVQDVFNEAAVAVTPRGATATRPPATAPEEARPAAEVSAADTETPAPASEAAAAAPATDEPPRVARRPAPPTAKDDEDGGDEATGASRASRFQVGALLGAGAGWASGMGDVNADVRAPSGFAAAKLGHLAVEAGYWLDESWMVSLQGRFQKVTGPTVVEANGRTYEPASGASAILATATWSPGGGPLRPFLSGGLGGGRIRHVVTLSGLHDCGASRNATCVDTVGAGPFLVGAGGGVTYDLGERLSLVVALETQLGAPRFTFNLDVNGGVAFRL